MSASTQALEETNGRGAQRARPRRALAFFHLLAGLAVALAALSACAPAVAGTTSSAPIAAGASAIPVEQGNTYYLRFDYTLDQFDMKPKDVTVSLWVPSGYASDVGDATNMFALHDVRVAEGWTAELLQVKAERTNVTTSASFGESRVDYRLWAVLKVVVPDGIVPGPYRLRGTLQARSGKTAPVSATLQVLSK
ncbi:MAG: hypothetical protein WC972_05320 [Trueperaceae bacterium]|jgi:hypothetical protein|nr:hypothetical protein [Truepera sp.]HRQ11024.1 hypothetical protein [Trueperaceae bacterium]